MPVVLQLDAAVRRTATVLPESIWVILELQDMVWLVIICPPTTVTGVPDGIALTVNTVDSATVDGTTPDCAPKGDGFVDTLNGTAKVPTIKVAVAVAFAVAGAVTLTQTDWPLAIVAGDDVNTAVQPMEYWPPAMLTPAGVLSPVISTVLEVRCALL